MQVITNCFQTFWITSVFSLAEDLDEIDSDDNSIIELDISPDSENEEATSHSDDGDGSENGSEASTEGSHFASYRSKTVISKITGQPKQVYPPIEPDYDSDSSTEDVSCLTYILSHSD